MVVLAALLAGCYSWHPISLSETRARLGTVEAVRLTAADSDTMVLRNPRLDGNAVTGLSRESGSTVRVPLDAVQSLEVADLNEGRTAIGAITLGLVFYGVAWFLVGMLSSHVDYP
jgi:hypothetical protein